MFAVLWEARGIPQVPQDSAGTAVPACAEPFGATTEAPAAVPCRAQQVPGCTCGFSPFQVCSGTLRSSFYHLNKRIRGRRRCRAKPQCWWVVSNRGVSLDAPSSDPACCGLCFCLWRAQYYWWVSIYSVVALDFNKIVTHVITGRWVGTKLLNRLKYSKVDHSDYYRAH